MDQVHLSPQSRHRKRQREEMSAGNSATPDKRTKGGAAGRHQTTPASSPRLKQTPQNAFGKTTRGSPDQIRLRDQQSDDDEDDHRSHDRRIAPVPSPVATSPLRRPSSSTKSGTGNEKAPPLPKHIDEVDDALKSSKPVQQKESTKMTTPATVVPLRRRTISPLWVVLPSLIFAVVVQAYTLYTCHQAQEQVVHDCQVATSELTLQLQESHRIQLQQRQQAAKGTREQQQALLQAQQDQQRLQKEFDELFQSATALRANRDDWERLAKHLEDDLLNPLEAQLESLQMEREQLQKEREQLKSSIYALEKEKEDLKRRLSQAGG